MSELKEFIIGVDVSKKTLEIAILEKATQRGVVELVERQAISKIRLRFES